jgi:ParB family chromosome partitioning protein
MAAGAETLLADTGWLPEPLRTPGRASGDDQAPAPVTEETPEQPSEKLPEDEDEPAAQNDDAGEPMIAAE